MAASRSGLTTALIVMTICLASCTGGPGRLTSAASTATMTPTTMAVAGAPSSSVPPTTVSPSSGLWAFRTIPGTGVVQDIAPTSSALYWLALPGPAPVDPTIVTPTRYDLTSGQMIHGAATSGTMGDPALTVTGGWVWIVLQVGAEARVMQLDPSTMAVEGERFLTVTDNTSFSPVPVLTATIGGPLWVADGEQLWSLNPSTGVVENEIETGNEIDSMSTDPTGALLYTGGQTPGQYGMAVTEYDARTGQQLVRSYQRGAIAGGTVAATEGGVWVSFRTGMAGPALELSSADLSTIVRPGQHNGLGPFDQIMGVGSGVSEGVLWLSAVTSLACTDPGSGVIRATEPTDVFDPIASGGRLYALSRPEAVVVITPPPACFA